MYSSRFLIIALVFATACSASRPFVAREYTDWDAQTPPPASELAYEVFLIGAVQSRR